MESWTIGILLGMASILIHSAAMVCLAGGARRVRRVLDIQHNTVHVELRKLVVIVTFICIALGMLHTLEAALWAVVFVQLKALGSFSDALFFSLDAMATRGASGLSLTENWRMLGAIESSDGVLLFGMSTALVFAVVQTDFAAIANTLNHSVSSR
ncbi:two pore domain potassium channel family protein [Burkholderia sp. LMG 21824]|uniref:two pore domain potassium channel family protein n=1 Tax=Burkholderia sp. LMG 21824 TaxID=3158172 RepID=UPI003C2EAB09